MYIRTKDGVYEVVGFDEECIIPSILIKVKSNYDIRITHCCKDDIIKQADTIEELCDEFVYNGWLYQNKIVDNCLIENSFDEETIPIDDEMISNGIYGAIWTSKGLIYVAKMNENGELELL